MNALTRPAGNGAVAAFGGDNPFAAAGSRAAGTTIFMKFRGASGDFLYGPNDDEMPHGTQFAADMNNTKWIWSFWWEGEVLENIETFFVENPFGYEHEPDHLPEDYSGDMSLEEIRAMQADRRNNFMDGWSVQAVLPMRGVDGNRNEYTLKLNAGVALNAFLALLKAYGAQYKYKDGQLPLVEISARSYTSKNKSVGKRFSPVLKLAGWASEEELLASAGEDPADYDDVADTPQETAPAAPAQTAAQPRPRRTRGDYA